MSDSFYVSLCEEVKHVVTLQKSTTPKTQKRRVDDMIQLRCFPWARTQSIPDICALTQDFFITQNTNNFTIMDIYCRVIESFTLGDVSNITVWTGNMNTISFSFKDKEDRFNVKTIFLPNTKHTPLKILGRKPRDIKTNEQVRVIRTSDFELIIGSYGYQEYNIDIRNIKETDDMETDNEPELRTEKISLVELKDNVILIGTTNGRLIVFDSMSLGDGPITSGHIHASIRKPISALLTQTETLFVIGDKFDVHTLVRANDPSSTNTFSGGIILGLESTTDGGIIIVTSEQIYCLDSNLNFVADADPPPIAPANTFSTSFLVRSRNEENQDILLFLSNYEKKIYQIALE